MEGIVQLSLYVTMRFIVIQSTLKHFTELRTATVLQAESGGEAVGMEGRKKETGLTFEKP